MKRKAELDADMAWSIIGRMGWGVGSTDYKAIANKFFAELKTAGMKRVEEFVNARVSELGAVVNQYERENNTQLEVGSDDGFSDLRYHVVGLGKTAFESAMKDPLLLHTRYRAGQYRESFHYCFMEPDPPRTQEDKDKTFNDLFIQMRDVRQRLDKAVNTLVGLSAEVNFLQSRLEQVKQDRETA